MNIMLLIFDDGLIVSVHDEVWIEAIKNLNYYIF